MIDLAGVKKPALKKVRMSADAMLKALLGSKHTVNLDLRANLKQVKKEVKEEVSHTTGQIGWETVGYRLWILSGNDKISGLRSTQKTQKQWKKVRWSDKSCSRVMGNQCKQRGR